MVFYRKYRPQKFAEIVGQDHVVKTILAQLASGKIGHAFLFAGPKGTGKTSLARILAKAVNCQGIGSSKKPKNYTLNPKNLVTKFGEPCNKCDACVSVNDGSALDLIEIDAASNRNIDDVRDLREKIKLSPVSFRFKVYIVDEVHMLTREAFNALLKTLEEPPAHAIFILCTTEAGKLPPTIVSRVQRFSFSRASATQLTFALQKIAKAENIKIDDEACLAIVQAADGSFRDAVSILDQISSSKKAISARDVTNLVVFSDWNSIFQFCEYLGLADVKKSVAYIENLYRSGADISLFIKEAVLFLEKLLLLKMNMVDQITDMEERQISKMKELGERFTLDDLQHLMKLFLIAESDAKIYPLPHISLLLAVCKYCLPKAEKADSLDIKDEKSREEKQSEDKEISSRVPKGQNNVRSIARIGKIWPVFLSKVKTGNAHVMAILRSAKPADFKGTTLQIEVFWRFHKEKLEEPKIYRMLSNIMEEVAGMPINMKFILNNDKSQLPKAVRASDVVDIAEADLERVAAEIFSK